MSLSWSDRARRDLLAIGRYIARRDPRAARAWVERLRDAARKTARMPHAGRVVPEFGRDDLRETIPGNYRIVYRVRGRNIRVMTVFEGHRLLRREDSMPEEP